MARAACWALVVALGATPDISQVFRFAFQQGKPADPEKSAPQGTLPSSPAAATQPNQSSAATSPARGDRLSDESRMAIIRAISGEFVRAQVALPGGKNGFHIAAAQPPIQTPVQTPVQPASATDTSP